LADLQAEVGKIVKERDEYLKEKIQLEIQVEGMAKQITQLQTEVSGSSS
jgi:predicted  nucleic acid-binding Zn-ribbon protein